MRRKDERILQSSQGGEKRGRAAFENHLDVFKGGGLLCFAKIGSTGFRLAVFVSRRCLGAPPQITVRGYDICIWRSFYVLCTSVSFLWRCHLGNKLLHFTLYISPGPKRFVELFLLLPRRGLPGKGGALSSIGVSKTSGISPANGPASK